MKFQHIATPFSVVHVALWHKYNGCGARHATRLLSSNQLQYACLA
jgi:hypothetical protein